MMTIYRRTAETFLWQAGIARSGEMGEGELRRRGPGTLIEH
jgi:hypothetical protein